MAILIMLVAASFISLGNFFMRRSIDIGGSSRLFVFVQMLFSLMIAILFNPVRTGWFMWSNFIGFIGIFGGVCFGIMMLMLGKALERGPASMTFAMLNSATIVPSILMAALFGSAFGHDYTPWHFVGSFFVVLGLFCSVSGADRARGRHWGLFALCAFAMNCIMLFTVQWRSIIIKDFLPLNMLVPFHCDISTAQWFLPLIFAGSVVINGVHYMRYRRIKKSDHSWKEVVYGACGGLANGLGIFCSIKASEVATSWENAMIFPLFSVSIIMMCNGWGRLIYKEKINWKGNLLCLAGIIIGLMRWNIIFG
jgi:drug/metabolite transporter (DMT)-like permease